jgi:EAL domain-containing protein (putative c-di-GMP-specific phosphodiesterase class I)
MTVNTLKDLRDLGVQIALDDFGMGYSSLRYLPRFPIQTLKIDRSFVGTMAEELESETIVRTIITMSHAMGLDVVAEGIESESHQRYLKAMQCDYGQGYLFSPAVSAERASLLLVGNGRIRRPSSC